MSDYYVYLLTNKTNEVLYVGVTNDITRRLYEHRQGMSDSFSKKYRTFKLVYLETYNNPADAISREKQIKKWRRDKKDFLIQQQNPDWMDLADCEHLPDPSAALGMTNRMVS